MMENLKAWWKLISLPVLCIVVGVICLSQNQFVACGTCLVAAAIADLANALRTPKS